MDAHYSYEDKYYVSGSFRRDGSSVFGSNHRWGNFWSVGGKWRVSGEEFLKDNSIITNATLRASYGTVGNQDIDWYAARGFYSSGYNYNEKPGMTPTSISNSDLTWETSKKFDIGFDLSLINRIHLTFDYYNEETSDALFEVPLSMTTGMSTVYQNIGAIRNRGIEASINASVINNNNLTWNIYANMTWNKNKIIKLSTDEPIEYTYQIIEEGRPYRQFYMKEYAGVDRENGKPLWYLNEEGNETTSDYNAAAKRYVGDADPKVLGGFGTNLSWKGFDFNMNFTYRLGGKVFDSGASFTGFGMANRTPLKDVALNSWTEENKDAKYPQYINGDPNKATQTSSRLLFISNFGIGGTIGNAVSRFFFGVMGLIAYVFPVLLLVGTFFAVSNRGNRVATVKLVAMILFDLFLCMLIELLTKGSAVDGAAAAYSYSFEHRTGGGFIGGLLAWIFCPNFGLAGSYVIDAIMLIISLVLITERSALRGMQKGGKKVYESARSGNERHKERVRIQREEREQRREEQALRRMDRKVEGVAIDTRVLPRQNVIEHSDEISELNAEDYLEMPEVREEKIVPLTSDGG